MRQTRLWTTGSDWRAATQRRSVQVVVGAAACGCCFRGGGISAGGHSFLSAARRRCARRRAAILVVLRGYQPTVAATPPCHAATPPSPHDQVTQNHPGQTVNINTAPPPPPQHRHHSHRHNTDTSCISAPLTPTAQSRSNPINTAQRLIYRHSISPLYRLQCNMYSQITATSTQPKPKLADR